MIGIKQKKRLKIFHLRLEPLINIYINDQLIFYMNLLFIKAREVKRVSQDVGNPGSCEKGPEWIGTENSKGGDF